MNSHGFCQSCAPGCLECNGLDKCYTCDVREFELIEGRTFGFCFPKCAHGWFRRNVYDNVD